MKGQWIGEYSGSNNGTIVVNVDDRGSYFQGAAYLNERNPAAIGTAAFFRTADKSTDFKVRTGLLQPIDPSLNIPMPLNALTKIPPNVRLSAHADVTGSFSDEFLQLSWTTDIGLRGTSRLRRATADKPSQISALNKSWDEYKHYVAGLPLRKFLFRGQSKPLRLRTSFHRSGRADLSRFVAEDVPALHRHLSARTKHVFNLNIADENGSFLNLVQHHGYPTPLLDWTYSPYVAAFFAYRRISSAEAASATGEDKVRVLILDHEHWKAAAFQSNMLAPALLHVSIREFIAIENERMIPQQGVSMITNVDDIESFIAIHESESQDVNYLSAIDLPKADRCRVVAELSSMGITAGALFPGLDGACEELTERNFQR